MSHLQFYDYFEWILCRASTTEIMNAHWVEKIEHKGSWEKNWRRHKSQKLSHGCCYAFLMRPICRYWPPKDAWSVASETKAAITTSLLWLLTTCLYSIRCFFTVCFQFPISQYLQTTKDSPPPPEHFFEDTNVKIFLADQTRHFF